MLASLDSGMTYEQLIVRVAEAAGVASYANGAAAIPTGAHNLDLCKRMVNDGYQRFLNGVRAGGKRPYMGWTFLKPLMTITLSAEGTGPLNIDTDAARYRIPIPVVAHPALWTIKDPDSVASATTCAVTGIDRVWASLSSTSSTGRPVIAAMAPLAPDRPGDAPGWEVVFWPRPDKAYSATARLRLQPRPLVALEERHVAGAEHDQTIIAMAIAAMKTRNRAEDAQQAALDADMLMDSSIAMDMQRIPATAGTMIDPSVGGRGTIRPDARLSMFERPYIAGP